MCVYRGLFLNVSLEKISKNDETNSGTFTFTVDPSLLNLKKMNISKYLNFSCDSTYSIASITYDNGIIELNVDYTEDMEDRSCILTLAYDPTIVDRPASQLTFDVKSNDMKLIVSNKLSELKQIKFIFGIIALIALGLFVISLPRKMLGVEMIYCCQIAFLSLCLY